MEELFYRLLHKKKPKSNDLQYLYEPIQPLKLNQNENQLLNQINEATLSISTYLVKSIQNFPSLFETNLKTLEETLEHLETISVPNKCVCAGIIKPYQVGDVRIVLNMKTLFIVMIAILIQKNCIKIIK